MITKKFEVNTPKKFDVLGQSDPDRMSIQNIEFMGRGIVWAKQIDANSCGYCLIQNASNFFVIPEFEGNPELVFSYINTLRNQSDQDSLSRTQNLPTPAMRSYFESKDFQVEEYLEVYDLLDIEHRIDQQNFDLIYTTSGIHYRGYAPGADGQYYLLDSTKDNPEIVDRESLMQEVMLSLGLDQNNRHNRVGFVVKNKKTFRIEK